MQDSHLKLLLADQGLFCRWTQGVDMFLTMINAYALTIGLTPG